ncbi:MAG: D-alanine--D-alanine ligase [Alphaproteobacteria bacterium]
MANSENYKKILILRGGISDEIEISKLSANQVYSSINSHYEVNIFDVNDDCNNLIKKIIKFQPHVVFNCLHGYFGEDGQIQSILNYLGFPYTHSGVATSSLLMNKIFSKKIFQSFGIQTPKTLTFDDLKNNFPLIVKPINGGSSNGLCKINDQETLNKFIMDNKINIKKLMFEEFIPGRELTVGILENKVCGVMEIEFSNEVYDYDNKYVDIAKHILNPKLPQDIHKKITQSSLDIHKKLNCNSISRIDFRYDDKKNELFLLEINTQPGLTKNSLLPEMAQQQGINFLELCKILIKSAVCEKF